jgi:hypothetical protein
MSSINNIHKDFFPISKNIQNKHYVSGSTCFQNVPFNWSVCENGKTLVNVADVTSVSSVNFYLHGFHKQKSH